MLDDEASLNGEILNAWSECLKDEIYRFSLVGTTRKSRVYRLHGRKQSYIAKRTLDKDSVERDVCVNQYLDSERIMQSNRPRMICFGDAFLGTFIIFSDDKLQDSIKGEFFASKAMEFLFHLHQFDGQSLCLPPVCCSHTPKFQEIARIACSIDVRRLEQSMMHLNIRFHVKKEILKLHTYLQCVKLEKVQIAPVLCHGDAHTGNFLWSYKRRNWFLIDWEFLHFDNPYFDLFQFIDATSPYTPLQNRVSRKHVLLAYAKNDVEFYNNKDRMRHWLHGYFLYAAFHLFWIVQRIWCDLEHGKFATEQLNRQLVETYKGLAGVMRDMGSI